MKLSNQKSTIAKSPLLTFSYYY